MRTLAIHSLLLAGFVSVANAGKPGVSEVPVYGSQLAGADRLFQEKSAFVPRTVLVEPGSLAGHWLSASNASILTVSLAHDTTLKKARSSSEEEFALQIQSGTNVVTRDFTGSYGPFRVYGIDVDADGREEIVLEHGEGRGTFVHIQKLEILTIAGNHFETLFEAKLNGYIWDPDQHDPVSWERTYSWQKLDGTGRFRIQLDLIPPAVVPKYCGSEVDLMVLQHPRLIFQLNAEMGRFEIMREDFRPLSALPKCRGPASER